MQTNVDYVPNIAVATLVEVQPRIEGGATKLGSRGLREEQLRAGYNPTRRFAKRRLRRGGTDRRIRNRTSS